MPRMVLELLTSWSALFGYGPAKEVWRLVPLCLMWCILQEQNVTLRRRRDIDDGTREAFAQHVVYLDSISAELECFYLCRFFKFIFCSFLLGALLYTSYILGLRPSALY